MNKKQKITKKIAIKSKIKKLILLIIFFIGIICLVSYIPQIEENNRQNKIEKNLLGSWTTDGYTIYEFGKNGKGALKIPIATYNFSYIIQENKIFIDFENENSSDSNYEISLKKDNLILKGINTTSGTYNFKRVNK